MKMAVEQLREQYKSISAIINLTRPSVDTTSINYKIGFIDGGLNHEYKPYRYDPVNANNIISKLTGKDAAEYELGFFDGIMSDNPKKELNQKFGMKFGSLQ